MKMKIGIDIFSLISKKKTGINWYAYHLIKNLQKIDKENFYILFASSIRGYIRKPYIKRNFEKENFHVSILFFPQFPPVYNDLFLAPIKLFS
ncbi:MAG: hypothetical protein N2589_07275, partial [bacterium]|nr:hypothetical protein [bacterium]